MEPIIKNKNRLIETLQNAVDAENMMYSCCGHIAVLIKNGRIRNKFNSYSQIAKRNKEFLIQQLNNLGVINFLPEDKCRFCKLKPESFSLLGAINLALEVLNIKIKLYKALLKLIDTPEDKKIFKDMLNEAMDQIKFFKSEKRFASKEELSPNFIDSYCIPAIASKLF